MPNGYAYNTDGLRTFKRVGANNYYYYYDGDRLLAQKWGTKFINFYYDENDSIYSFTYYDGSSYNKYYLYKNLQGDVVQIRDKHNAVVANYSYDAWGNLVVVTDGNGADITSNTTGIAYINPIRYRGYYYDTETGFYYLQSRYYDPAIGRFISADSLMVNSPAIYGYNLFAYCGNNPVMRVDESGYFWHAIVVGALIVAALTGCSSSTAEPEVQPGRFSSADEAALDFASSVYSESMYIRHEYGAEIYSVTIDGETTYDYTDPRAGLPHSVIMDPSKIPSESSLVGFVHTHPNSNVFSSDDKTNARTARCNIYMVCSNQDVKMYNYKTRKISAVGTFVPTSLSPKQKKGLVDRFIFTWEAHLPDCGKCQRIQWPTS